MATEPVDDNVAKGDASEDDGKPPFFRTWRGMYAFVLGTLAVLVVILSAVTWFYR
jgi:hypothetical protein